MSTRSLLVYAPPLPLQFNDLLPHAGLAAVAGGLLDAGHDTEIVDFGQLPTEGGGRRVQTDRSARVQALLDAGPADFVIFAADTRRQWAETGAMAGLVRWAWPSVRMFAMGAYVECYGAIVMAKQPAIDGVLMGQATESAVRLADRWGSPNRWSQLPGLVLRDAEPQSAATSSSGGFQNGPPTRYDGAVYPAIALGRKWPIFTLTSSYDPHVFFLGDARASKALYGEAARLARLHGARAFHLNGAEQLPGLLYEFSELVLNHRLPSVFSFTGHVSGMNPRLLKQLWGAGARAVGLEVASGSQRLLDDFFDERFAVTQAIAAVRACAETSLHSTVSMTYPCPREDRHTFEETRRFLRLACPNAVEVAPPVLAPGSRWHQCPRDYGIRMSYPAYERWVSAPGDSREAALPYGMKGWSAARIREAKAALDDARRDFHITLGLGEQEALAARIAGFVGREHEFQQRMRRALDDGDVENAEELLGRFTLRLRHIARTRPTVGLTRAAAAAN